MQWTCIGRLKSCARVAGPTTALVVRSEITHIALSVNVSGFGVARVTEAGSDDDVAMDSAILRLVIQRKIGR